MRALRVRVAAPEGVIPTGRDVKTDPGLPVRSLRAYIGHDRFLVVEAIICGAVTGRMRVAVEPKSAAEWGLKSPCFLWVDVEVADADALPSAWGLDIRLKSGKSVPCADFFFSVNPKEIYAVLTLAKRLAPDGQPWERGEKFASPEELAAAVDDAGASA